MGFLLLLGCGSGGEGGGAIVSAVIDGWFVAVPGLGVICAAFYFLTNFFFRGQRREELGMFSSLGVIR